MISKMKIVVLMGGKSSEREVSISSGKEVVKNLDPKKYIASQIIIPNQGDAWIINLQKINPDVVFIAMHGPFGEDGTLQGVLETLGIPYTCSGILASALAMDKLMFRKVMVAEGILIPKYFVLQKGELANETKNMFNPPYFVKPNDQGSSVGASVVKDIKDLDTALKSAHKYSELAIVDEYLDGLELTCAVMGNKNPFALPVIEIHALKGDFFDYKSKYTDKGSEEIVPARISDELTKKVQDLAVKVYKIVGCKGYGRVDFILKGNEPIVLEINTIPGLTPASLAPKAAKSFGLTYPAFIDKIIEYATEK